MPSRPTAHDHALPVETLAEKDARLRREQGLPAVDAPHRCPPRPCYWHEDTDSTRYLIPGCLTRIHNPDIDECDCPTTNRQLEKTRQQLAEAQKALRSLRSWHDQIVNAVHAHHDGVQIMRAASTGVDR
ncbi:hypothetical protein ACFWM0_14880 [Streptomyces sp. NPDC058405]|uniref:hypothetical protein n=1 Tax=Streptomyces sp. NPDC058405 TaxID=3346482 RepID=UPI00365A59EE